MIRELSFGLLDPVNQFALLIGLPKLDRHLQLDRAGTDFGFNVGQGGVSIHLRLPLAEQVQVRAVEEKYLHSVFGA